MEDLTKSEEGLMRIFWKIERGTVRDAMKEMKQPLPPYTTVASVARMLEKKGFIGHKAYGKTYEYFPVVPKTSYRKKSFNDFFKHYFEGSAKNLFSFMVKEKNLTDKEAEALRKIIDENAQDKKV